MTFTAQSGALCLSRGGWRRGSGAGLSRVEHPGRRQLNTRLFLTPAISGTRVVWEASGSGPRSSESYLDERPFSAVADIATDSPSTPGTPTSS